MFNHAPTAYDCPFCMLAAGARGRCLHTTPQDVILRSKSVIAFVASHWWRTNPGHVLVIPAVHYENIYDLPSEVGSRVFAATRLVAIAMKTSYQCDGVSVRQHNEPAGNQDVWHYHMHVFPRYVDDRLYLAGDSKYPAPVLERLRFSSRMRGALRELCPDVPKG
jgi:histidine triad (HIT) family protein